MCNECGFSHYRSSEVENPTFPQLTKEEVEQIVWEQIRKATKEVKK